MKAESKLENIQLSILIITTPSRFEMSYNLYNNLLKMIGSKEIEVIMIFDNKKRTIGAKREAAKNMSQGKYFMFCDSDDEFTSLDEIYEATFTDVDVIDFKAECRNADGSTYIVTQRLDSAVEHNTENGKYLDCNRPPFPNCAWSSKFKVIPFGDINYGEDWVFVSGALTIAETETFIDEVLFKYNFNPEVTEASTESNIHWENPNNEEAPKRVVVNLSTQKYWPGQQRLIESLQDKTDADILLFGSEEEVGALPHSENNYSFKPLAIHNAYELGYRQILWLDASMNVIKDIQPIFDIIEKDGYFFQDSGWPNSRWTTPNAKDYFGTDEGIMLSSGVLGVNLSHPIGYSFFDQWMQAMRDGMFNGDWDNYRHDQSCASLIAHKMGLKLQAPNTFFVYGNPGNPYILEETLILADGIV